MELSPFYYIRGGQIQFRTLYYMWILYSIFKGNLRWYWYLLKILSKCRFYFEISQIICAISLIDFTKLGPIMMYIHMCLFLYRQRNQDSVSYRFRWRLVVGKRYYFHCSAVQKLHTALQCITINFWYALKYFKNQLWPLNVFHLRQAQV